MYMRRAYLSDGCILEFSGGKSKWKRVIRQNLEDSDIKVWFRPCKDWYHAAGYPV